MNSHNITKNSELLPCPFCGGEAELRTKKDNSKWTDRLFYRYRCADCHAGISEWSACLSGKEWGAVEKWNTRAERTCRNDKDKFAQFFNGYYFVCSECGWSIPDIGNAGIEVAAALMDYCPKCGARVVE